MTRSIQIAPSLLSADFLNLQRDVELIASASQPPEWLHIDVMDGHFVPNLTIGPVFVKSLKKITDIKLDVHLMIDNPGMQADWYLDAGADLVVVHVESFAAAEKKGETEGETEGTDPFVSLSLDNTRTIPTTLPLGPSTSSGLQADRQNETKRSVPSGSPTLSKGMSFAVSELPPSQIEELKSLLERIRAAGALAGVSLNPDTPVEVLEPLYGYFDLVLVMSVHPGFGAQSFIASSLDKLKKLVEEREKSIETYGAAKGFLIEIDGGINLETAALAAAAGADILVAGNAIFGTDNPVEATAQIRECANAALA